MSKAGIEITSLTFLGALCVLGGYFLAAPAAGLTPAELLTPELQRRPVVLAGVSGGVISFFDEDRTLARASVEGFVRLSLPGEADRDGEPAASGTNGEAGGIGAAGMIGLTDGQRIAGRYTGDGAGGEGDVVVWEHPALGRVDVPLDDVRRLVPARMGERAEVPWSAISAAVTDDVVRLTNGDTLSGFVISLGDAGLTLQPNAGGEVTLPLDRVASLALSNPDAAPPADADLVVLADGSRLRGRGLAITGDAVRFTPTLAAAAGPVELPLGTVRRVDFASSGVRLVDLADRPIYVVSGGEAFGLDLPPRVDGSTIYLHAPVTVRFDLPAGARRLAYTAELDLPGDVPPERAAWAEVSVSVTGEAAEGAAGAAGAEIAGVTLNAEQPVAESNLNLAADAAAVTLTVDPRRYGPVLDRVRLRDAVLLVDVAGP